MSDDVTSIRKLNMHLIGLLAPVLQDEGLAGLCLSQTADDPVQIADGACAFYRALVRSGLTSAADYLRDCLLNSENVFSQAAAHGKAAPLLPRIDAELNALKELILTDCTVLREKLPKAARDLFPAWQSGTFALTAKTLADEYEHNGYGAVRTSPALLFNEQTLTLSPIERRSTVLLSDLKEYAEEKEAAIRNTLAFIEGKPAHNVLLYGDRGTGKSSTVHALLNEFAPRGLRLLQVNKSAIPFFPVIKEQLAKFPRLRFIIFLDDLSFDEEDNAYAALKAALEGSLVTAENARIYATTNRRHLVRETRSAREGDDVHVADTQEEQLSLFDRFGLVITYIAPDKREYVSILQQILKDRNITLSDEEASALAERYALRKGGRSPRAAKQLADAIQSQMAPMC